MQLRVLRNPLRPFLDKINLHKYICTVLEKHTKTIVPMYCTSDAGDNAHLAKTKSESRHKKPSQSQHGDDLTEYVRQISGRETIQYIYLCISSNRADI